MSEQRVVALEKRVFELEKEIKFLRDKLLRNNETPGERREAALERHRLIYERQNGNMSTADITCDCGT